MPSTAVEAPGSSGRRGVVLAGVIAATITAATVVLLFAFAHEGDPKARAPKEAPVVEPEPPPSQPAASRPKADGTGIPNCDRYIAKMERFLACDKVPQDARDGARQGIDAMKNSWGDTPSMPAGVGRVANDACLQAIDMLEQGVAAMGCRI